MSHLWRRLVLGAMGGILAASIVIDTAHLTSTPAGRPNAKPTEAESKYRPVLAQALDRIPLTDDIAVITRHAPSFFTYYLYPRAAYFSPDLKPEWKASQHPLILKHDIHWLVGARIRSR